MIAARPKGKPFELFLFHRDLRITCQLLQSGASAGIIDLENRSKQQRQMGFDTEINSHTIADLGRLRAATDKPVLCRISGPDASEQELADVTRMGADEIIIPMVRHIAEVERIARLVGDHCKICIMIETVTAAKQARALCALPVERIYVGLNDLCIERGSNTIFAPLIDGCLDRIRDICWNVQFGFGGLTLPDCGAPVAAKHLYAEMARLECSFTFLRRSFYRDIAGKDGAEELAKMNTAMGKMQTRTPQAVEDDRRSMFHAIKRLEGFAGD